MKRNIKENYFEIIDMAQSGAFYDENWFQSVASKSEAQLKFCEKCKKLPLINSHSPDLYLDIVAGGKIPKNKPMYGVWDLGIGIISIKFVEAYPKLRDYLCFSNIYYGFDQKTVESNYLAFVGKQTVQLSRIEGKPYAAPVYEENYQDYLKEPICPACGRPKQRPVEPMSGYCCLYERPKNEISTLTSLKRYLSPKTSCWK